ncbi:phosphatase PAP2 family protein [Pontibacter chinhatensis]|uniref:Undecaprenyl-diphosphatase n=1 Tax=Pontibacter chinhatensis TaxID=1436961 RepID=A0A1I2N2N8_9BACT|nr:phosphatase PAP2 family protein [Pontibacter chinhatensis]SFF98022.1 undecaprenyl-diphosphatase [Pontibacter chinhatensis]
MKGLQRIILHLVALLTVKFLLISLLFVVSLLVLFHLIHDVFADRDTGFDAMLFTFTDSIASPAMTRAMHVFSFLGSARYLVIMPAILALLFSLYRDMRWNGLRVLIITFTTSMLNEFLKHYYERPRPEFAPWEIMGFSFPSGHTMNGGVFHGLLLYIIWTTVKNKTWRWVLSVFLTLAVILVGFSRIYLHKHYATDVAAGYLAGILWLILSLFLMSRLEHFYVSKYKMQANSKAVTTAKKQA